MTIIAAMQISDEAVLVAADMAVSDYGGLLDIDPGGSKLNQLGSFPIVWGCSGNGSVGDLFTVWLKKANIPTDISELIESARGTLADLNKREREMAIRAGVQLEPSRTTSCLLAGWFPWGSDIIELDDKGQRTSYARSKFYAIGSGAQVAFIAAKTMRAISIQSKRTAAEDIFRHIMEVVVSMRDCRPPVHIWRITCSTVDDITVRNESNVTERGT